MNKLSQPPIEASWRNDNINWMKWGLVRQALLLPVNQAVNSYFTYSPINKSKGGMPRESTNLIKQGFLEPEEQVRQQVMLADDFRNNHVADPPA